MNDEIIVDGIKYKQVKVRDAVSCKSKSAGIVCAGVCDEKLCFKLPRCVTPNNFEEQLIFVEVK